MVRSVNDSFNSTVDEYQLTYCLTSINLVSKSILLVLGYNSITRVQKVKVNKVTRNLVYHNRVTTPKKIINYSYNPVSLF
jgi:hypothetical protein